MNANEGTLTELYAFSMAISCLIYKGIYMTIGIYKITCKENGKHYIGQSIDIERRIYDHFHKYRSSQTRSKISKAIYDIGVDKFEWEILEECSIDELDKKEIEYIKKYDSCNHGYNISKGGNISGVRVMSEEDVYDIRERYLNKEKQLDVYELYKEKYNWHTFHDVWIGKGYEEIHHDVYKDDLKEFQKTNRPINFKNGLTYEDVLFIKQCKEDGKYSKAEIYQLYEDVMTMNGFSSIWYNYSYKAIQPIKNPDRPKKVDHRYCKLNVTTIRDECSGVELG